MELSPMALDSSFQRRISLIPVFLVAIPGDGTELLDDQ